MIARATHVAIVLFAVFASVPASAQEWAAKMFRTTIHDFDVVARDKKPNMPSFSRIFMSRRYISPAFMQAVHAQLPKSRMPR